MVYETDYKACEAYLFINIYSDHVSSKIKIKNKKSSSIGPSKTSFLIIKRNRDLVMGHSD